MPLKEINSRCLFWSGWGNLDCENQLVYYLSLISLTVAKKTIGNKREQQRMKKKKLG
jgi:hypothetical protein